MQNNKKTVIRINGEPITMCEFKDFSLDVLVHCVAHGIIEDGEDDAILDFIHHVTDCLEELELDELTEVHFITLQAGTAMVLGFKTTLFSKVDGKRLGDFTNIWTDLLFTDTLGSTFEETYANLSTELYGGPCHPWF